MIPEIPEDFQCMWDDCELIFKSAQAFYWHVQNHILMLDSTSKGFSCLWKGILDDYL